MAERRIEDGLARPWPAFLEGLTRPSGPAIVGALVVALCVVAVTAVALDGRSLSRIPPRVLMASPADADCLVTLRAARIAEAPRDPAGIAILGASGTLQALPEDEELQRIFREEFRQPVRCHNLCVPGMGLPEYLAVADSVAPRIGYALVINVCMRQLLFTPKAWDGVRDRPRIGLRSSLLDHELERMGIATGYTGNYLVDFRGFLLPRLLPAVRHLVFGTIQPERHLNILREEDLTSKLSRFLPLSRGLELQLEASHTRNLAALGRLVEGIRSRGTTHVVFLETTWHPEFVREYPMEDYRHMITSFAREHGVPYWDLNAEADLRDPDFSSLGHLQDPDARRRYTRLLAQRLASLAQENRL